MLVKSINLASARFMDFYEVMSLALSFLSKEDLDALNLTQEADRLQVAYDVFDKAIKQAQKTGITNGIITADDERDNIFTGFTGSLRSLTRFPDEDTAQAAARLLQIVEKYGAGITRLPQREETAVLKNISAELKSPENMALLLKTNQKPWAEKLDESNTRFDALYEHRTEKEAEFITGLTRTERANTQAAFENLVRAIEANAYLKGEAAYKPLADKINTEVAKVQQTAKMRSTAAKPEVTQVK